MKHLSLYENHRSDQFSSEDDLVNFLIANDIPVEQWGKGSAKTVKHLYNEILEKESVLSYIDGKLIRSIEFVSAQIFYDSPGGVLKLVEEKQIFKDGRVRSRYLESSVSEKMKADEGPRNSIIRGIEEELKIAISMDQIEIDGNIDETEESNSYPGLLTRYKGYKYKINLRSHQYNPEGYIEHQRDKSTYFKWEIYDWER
jgi:hypothetical protein